MTAGTGARPAADLTAGRERAQSGLVADDQGRALGLQDLALLEIGKRVYEAADKQQAQQSQGSPPGAEPQQPSGDDKGYVDADYKIVDDDDKKS